MNIQNISTQLDAPFKNRKIASIASWLLLAGVIPLLIWLSYYAWATILDPYPLEYREGAAQVITQILLNGGNPFILANQPFSTYVYGIGYNLAVLPFAALWGNTLAVHRFVSILFIFLSLLVSSWALYRIHRNIAFAITGGSMIILGMISLNGAGAFPNALGDFLLLVSILVVWARSFDKTSLVISAVLGLAAFYTKPYFVVSFAIVLSYTFLFVSKKKGVFLGLLFSILFLITAIFVRLVLELYFLETVFTHTEMLSFGSVYYLMRQMFDLNAEFLPSFLCGLMILVVLLVQRVGQKTRFKDVVSSMDIFHFNLPLFQTRFNFFFYVFLCTFLTIVFILGSSQGAYMTYLYQLILPPFFLCLFQEIKPSSRLALICVPILLFNILTFCDKRLNPAFLQEDVAAWQQLNGYLNESKSVLNSPILTSDMLSLDMKPIDSGHSEYYYYLPKTASFLISPDNGLVKARWDQYIQSIDNSIKQKKFDRIMITEDYSPFASVDLISQTYKKVDTIAVTFPRLQFWRDWKIEIWEPRN